MSSRQEPRLQHFHQKLWACHNYSEVKQLALQYSDEPIFVDKGCAEWCFVQGMKREAALHAVEPIILGLKYPNNYYEDILDSNAIGQCIFFLFSSIYNERPRPFHVANEDFMSRSMDLNIWGKLFCLAHCYLGKSIQLLENRVHQLFEPYEARADLTINGLSTFDPSIPFSVWSEMIAHDYLLTGKFSEIAGHSGENDRCRSIAIRFINEKEPMRLQSESLESIAERGVNSTLEFFKEREENFQKNTRYACTEDELRSLVANS